MKISWSRSADDFVDSVKLDRDLVEDVVRNPEQTSVDPRSNGVGHKILRLRRGDVVVCVGYREEDEPTIIFVHLSNPDESGFSAPRGSKSGVGIVGADIPASPQELIRRAQKLGLEVRWGKHPMLYLDGGYVTAVAGTPGDRNSIKMAWRRILSALREKEDGNGED